MPTQRINEAYYGCKCLLEERELGSKNVQCSGVLNVGVCEDADFQIGLLILIGVNNWE